MEPPRRRYVRLDFVGSSATGITVLQRHQATSVQRELSIRGVRVQALPNHQDGFAVFVPARSNKGDISAEGYISSDLLPNKMESVSGEPHVFSAAADGEGPLYHRAGMKHPSDVAVVVERAQSRRRALCGGRVRHGDDQQGGSYDPQPCASCAMHR